MSARVPRRSGPRPARPLARALLLVLVLACAACSSGGERRGAAAATTSAPATTAPAATGAGPSTTKAPATSAPATPTSARAIRYTFPVQPQRSCDVSYGHFHHDYPATDIFARRGCRFVAPTDGTVTEVARVDRWDPSTDLGADRGGRSVAMVGVDGVRYYGSHLERVADRIEPGARVRAGQPLGLIDNSGDARSVATHLHFGISWPTRPGIWWVRRGMVYPWPYLDSWRAGGTRSPAAAVRAALAEAGTAEPPCRSGC
jgi:murein DD-endopeptidase MepM/ murein hydrolase activator NlpD